MALLYQYRAQAFMSSVFKVRCWEIMEMVFQHLEPEDLMNFGETCSGALAVVALSMESKSFLKVLLSKIIKQYMESSSYHQASWQADGGLTYFLQNWLVQCETVGRALRKSTSLLCEFDRVNAVERFMGNLLATADEAFVAQVNSYYERHGDAPQAVHGVLAEDFQVTSEKSMRLDRFNGVVKDPFLSLLLGHMWAAACANLSIESKKMVIGHMMTDMEVHDRLGSYLARREHHLETNGMDNQHGPHDEATRLMFSEEIDLRILLDHFFGVYNAMIAPIASIDDQRQERAGANDSGDELMEVTFDESFDLDEDLLPGQASNPSNGEEMDDDDDHALGGGVIRRPSAEDDDDDDEEVDSFDPNVPLQKAFKRRLFGTIVLEMLMEGMDHKQQAMTMMLLVGPVKNFTRYRESFYARIINVQQRTAADHVNVSPEARARQLQRLDTFSMNYECGVDYPCSPLLIVAKTIKPVEWTALNGRRVLMDSRVPGLAGRREFYGRPDLFLLSRMVATRFAFFQSELAAVCLGKGWEEKKRVFVDALMSFHAGLGLVKFHHHNFGAMIRNAGKSALKAVIRRIALESVSREHVRVDWWLNASYFLGSVVYAECVVKGDADSALRLFKATLARPLAGASQPLPRRHAGSDWDLLTLNAANFFMIHAKSLMMSMLNAEADIEMGEHSILTMEVDSQRTGRAFEALCNFTSFEKIAELQLWEAEAILARGGSDTDVEGGEE